jgi:hypothetical protein
MAPEALDSSESSARRNRAAELLMTAGVPVAQAPGQTGNHSSASANIELEFRLKTFRSSQSTNYAFSNPQLCPSLDLKRVP